MIAIKSVCTCPADHPEYVRRGCPVHFGTGWGFCVPHGLDTGQETPAVGLRKGVPLCASCIEAHDAAAERRGTR